VSQYGRAAFCGAEKEHLDHFLLLHQQRSRSLGIIASEDDCIFAAAETSKYSLANFHPSMQPAALRNCSFSTEARRPFRLLLGLFIHRTQNSRRITLRGGRSVGVSGARCPFFGRPMEKICTLNWWGGGVLQVVGLA
jgi:hypothetical protein